MPLEVLSVNYAKWVICLYRFHTIIAYMTYMALPIIEELLADSHCSNADFLSLAKLVL